MICHMVTSVYVIRFQQSDSIEEKVVNQKYRHFHMVEYLCFTETCKACYNYPAVPEKIKPPDK